MPAADVVELIKSDHREVERLFDLLKTQPATRSLNSPVLCSLLIAHSRAEEAEVYPVAKSEAGETDEVAHSQGEHAEAEHMLEQMAALDPESAQFASALDELIKALHVGDGRDMAEVFVEYRSELLGGWELPTGVTRLAE